MIPVILVFMARLNKINSEVSIVPRGGGGCSGIMPFYDVNGNAQGASQYNLNYTGPAPLYHLTGSDVGMDWPGCEYYEHVEPDIVLSKGVSYFPLHVKLSVPQKWIRSGESTILNVEISIDEQFGIDTGEFEYVIPWAIDEEGEIFFSVYASNFDIAPKDKASLTQDIKIGKPIIQKWVIASKERASGTQVIAINLSKVGAEADDMFADLVIETRPIIGIDPIILAWVAGIGTLGVWIINLVKIINDMKSD